MRRTIVYELDLDDPTGLSAKAISELEGMLADFVLDEEQGEGRSPTHPGLKAMRLIKSRSPFTRDDVEAMGAYVQGLLARLENRRSRLTMEKDQIAHDPHSRKAYEFFEESLVACAERAGQIVSTFHEEFFEARSSLA